MVHDKVYVPTAIFRKEKIADDLRYYPLNDLAIDLSSAYNRAYITKEGLIAFKRTGINVELRE